VSEKVVIVIMMVALTLMTVYVLVLEIWRSP